MRLQKDPKKRYMDSLKENQKTVENPADDWKVLINQKLKVFEERRVSHCQLKRAVRKRDNAAQQTAFHQPPL